MNNDDTNAPGHSGAIVKRIPRRFNRRTSREGYERDSSYVGTTDADILRVEMMRDAAVMRDPAYSGEPLRVHVSPDTCAEEVRRHGFCRHCEEQ